MLKHTLNKTICFTALLSFTAAIIPVQAQTLAPVSFSKMYNLAQKGEVQALRSSVRRGMNIDSTNGNGDTGLCVAAARRDAYTYNVFLAAGANPRHPCVQKIADYENFVYSSKAVPVNSTARAAYGKIGQEKFSLSPTTWWILGGLAVGGSALALSSGGGGGGSSSGSTENTPDTYIGVGNTLAADGTVIKSTDGVATNYDAVSVTNANTTEIDKINFYESTITGAKLLNIALQAQNGGTYDNAENTNIQQGSGTIGMAAVNNSSVNNFGFLKTDASNAAMAIMATKYSQATNDGKGVVSGSGATNGIYLVFSGSEMTDNIIGMYADTSSTIKNNGDIYGSATTSSGGEETGTSSKNGSIIGMETRIINTGVDAVQKTSIATNSGNISLNARDSGAGGQEIKLNLIGMGSYLENDFLNGSKNIQRAEKSVLNNEGNISLNYTGAYSSPSEETLRKGIGGIVGMRADANTTATNQATGYIKISLNDNGSSSNSADVAAGMQSVHKGNLTNNGNIVIQTTAINPRVTYGMLSVEGSGNVSGLYTDTNQTLTNTGSIRLTASNGYGMASYNGGILTNNGEIIIASDTGSGVSAHYKNNVGMYGSGDGTQVSLVNNGLIDVYSHESFAMKNEYSGNTTITNDGIINIRESAIQSYAFGGKYSQIKNNGTINYYATAAGEGEESSGKVTVKDAVISTKQGDESDSSSNTERINNNGDINLIGASYVAAMRVNSAQGGASNSGNIVLNDRSAGNTTGSAGMYLSSDTINRAEIINETNGVIQVNTDYSAAMASDSKSTSAIVNNGKIYVKGNQNNGSSYAMYSTQNSNLTNNGVITLEGDGNIGFYSSGTGENEARAYISNNQIVVTGTHATIFALAKDSTTKIKNIGTIDCRNQAACDTLTYYEIEGNYELNNAYHTIKGGNLIKVDKDAEVTIASDSRIIAQKGIILNGENGGKSINKGTLTLVGADATAMLSGNENTSTNSGNIYIESGATNAIGIDIKEGGIGINDNNGNISVKADNSYGVYVQTGAKSFENKSGATISVLSSNSYGIYSTVGGGGDGDGTNITNSGKIIVGNVSNSSIISGSYGMYVNNNVSATNNGEIFVYGSGNYGIYATAQAKEVINSETGKIIATDGVAMYAEAEGSAINRGTIEGTSTNVKDETTSTASTLSSRFIRAENKGVIRNNGIIKYSGTLDFDESNDGTGIIEVNSGGKYYASNLKGTIVAGADITQKDFATVYTNPNSFIGQDNGLNVKSGSYLFNAEKKQNSEGNLDVVMTMKSFDEVMSNQNLAEYLKANYAAQHGENTFNLLKSAATAQSFNSLIVKQFGFNFVPNLTKQNFDLLNNINREINSEIGEDTLKDTRYQVKTFSYKNETDAQNVIGGYKDKIVAIYGFSDTKINNNFRAGYGMAAVRAESDFDDDSSRYNNVVNFFAPLSYSQSSLKTIVKPKIGFGRGHYRRVTDTESYKANTKEYFYGADVEVKQNISLDIVEIEPVAGFNLTGIYQNKIKENNQGLLIDGQNIVSSQSVLGMDLKKEITFDRNNSLSLVAGGRYYHEFGERSTNKIGIQGMTGHYEIIDERLKRDYGLLSLKAQYDYRDLSVNASFNAPLNQKTDEYYLLGIGYKF